MGKVISTISVMTFAAEYIESVLAHLNTISKNWNWHTRNEVTIFVNNFVYSNVYVLRSKPEWIESFLGLILKLLTDEKNEIRDSARKTLR